MEREIIRKEICKILGAMAFADERSHFNDYMNDTTDRVMQRITEHEEVLKKQKDLAYSERNKLVALLSKVFPSSIEKHEGEDWEDDWRNVVFIWLPTGQCSWHIHDSELPMFSHLTSDGKKWDGHSNEEKYARCEAVAADYGCVIQNKVSESMLKHIEELERKLATPICSNCGREGHDLCSRGSLMGGTEEHF